MEERRVMNGTVTVSIRWAQDRRYVLAVKEGALTIEVGFSNLPLRNLEELLLKNDQKR